MSQGWAKFAVLRRRPARHALVTLSAILVATTGLVAAAPPALASASSDQATIKQLEQQIAAQGEQAQALVTRYNEVQAHLDALNAQITHDKQRVAADQRVEAAATSALERVAIKAYISGNVMDSPTLSVFSGTWSASNVLEQNQYLGAVNNNLDDVVTAQQLARAHTSDAQRGLQSEQHQVTETLHQLASAHDAATAAINADEAQLTHVRGDLRALVAAAEERDHERQEEAERRLAASQQTYIQLPSPTPTTSAPPTTSPDPPPSVTPTSGSYENPLRAISALSPERIDEGVDYSGFGPVYAIGDGVVVNTVGNGWPGGTFIAYRMTDGPASGLVVYVAEDVEPNVQVGDTVSSGTVIGQMFEGPDGIETGWADGSSLPDTMARTYGQFDGSNSSAFGYNFSQLLESLGAPGGVLESSPSGELPSGWPSW